MRPLIFCTLVLVASASKLGRLQDDGEHHHHHHHDQHDELPLAPIIHHDGLPLAPIIQHDELPLAPIIQHDELPLVPIIQQDNVRNDDGSFRYLFHTANQIQAEVQGELRQIGDQFGTVMRGSYSFVTPEGRNIAVTWVADENGFQTFGDTLILDQ
ncbi:larval cuticle protein LCP-22-like [Pollicipes pollicipes]|uniref:larval cuticle protein LCP-22-like n=1 Tax=Pollicipes pollicipes TaxID=41117 RepID=UPI001884F8B3|nr:larval cuticle protein LCP-22-like [Pollicipes pollicipes]